AGRGFAPTRQGRPRMTLPTGFAERDPTLALHPLHFVNRDGLEAWRGRQPTALVQWMRAHGFDAAAGSQLTLPGGDGALAGAVLGVGDALDPFSYAHAPRSLPAGHWEISGELDDDARRALQLGWGLGAYRFNRYRDATRVPAQLVADGFDAETADILAACLRVRDLVNTPTQDMGPQELEDVAREVANRHGAKFESIVGDELLEQNFPSIHAVGRASHRAPRPIRLDWGSDAHEHVVLVGKGV